MKSPSSMRNGRFHPFKYRCKVQKMGVLYPPSFQNAKPIPKLVKTSKKKKKKRKDGGRWADKGSSSQTIKLWAMAGEWPPVTGRPRFPNCWSATSGCPLAPCGCPKLPSPKFPPFLMPTFFCTCGQLLLVGSTTSCPYFS
jgi:hypothetical protein